MNMQSVREIAKQRGVTPRKLGKIELIRTLQLEEGNFDCFAKVYVDYCDQFNYLWREDCFSLSAQRGGMH